MKPFLGIDLTTDKNNDLLHGSVFMVQKTSAALSDALNVSVKKTEKTIEKSKLPLILRIVQYLCAFATIIILRGILKSDVSITEGYHNAPWIYWLAGICAVVWLVLWLAGKKKSNTVMEAEETTQTMSHMERVADAIYTELSVPANAKAIDILSFFYKVKDSEIKVCEKPMQLYQYSNPEFKIFADEENFYLVNLEGKYAFPLSSIVKVHTVKKHIRILSWNKDIAFNEGIYKPFKLAVDNYGCLHCKEYNIVEILHSGETYGIYIPCYDFSVFEKIVK